MLVLTREKDEEIVIGQGPNAAIIKVLEILGPRVRLGVTAPREVEIDRREIRESKIRDNGRKAG